MQIISDFYKHSIKSKRNILFLAFLIVLAALILQLTQSLLSRPGFIRNNSDQKPSAMHLQTHTVLKLLKTASAAATPSPKPTPYVPQVSGTTLQVPILMYHYIGNNPNPADKERYALSVPPDHFADQMKYLAANAYTTLTFDTLYAALKKQVSLPPKPVILTFDDGYEDFFYNAFPILLQYKLHATEFIPTGLMNQGYYLSWAQIKQMQTSGLVSFEAHSVHHYNMPSLSATALRAELVNSKNTLQSEVGVPVNFFAYPYGTYNAQVIQAVKAAGFFGAAATWASKIQSEGTLYDMPRIRVGWGTDINSFKALL